MYKILIADDEKKLRETLRDYLEAGGIQTVLAENGSEACKKALAEHFDLILLDVMMPEMNGIEALKEIRRYSDVPALFLSALGEEKDLLKGYGAGADDYIVKPFSLAVLREKCLAMIRRNTGADKDNRLTMNGITLDFSTRKVFAGQEEILLSGKDFQLLSYLMENKNIVLDREKILSRIWGYDFEGDARVVDTHIKRIRKALKEKSDCIVTVIGAGYVFKEGQI